MTNVCFLLQDTGSLYGAERATLDLAHGLQRTGAAKVHFLLIEETRLVIRENRLRAAMEEKGLPFTAIPMAGRFSWGSIQHIRRELRERGASVLHSVGYKATVLGGFASGWGKILPAVSTVHGWLFRADYRERFYGWLEILALKQYTRVITLSRFYHQMLKSLGVKEKRLVRIPSGLDPREMRPTERMDKLWSEPGPFTVGMLGRMSGEKNHRMFLKAARMIRDAGEPVRFLIAGSGREKETIRRWVEELRLTPDVELQDYQPRETFFARVHALVLCSTMENFPYSVLEAMSWGRPVLATAVGGLPDLVEDSKTGYLIPLDDAPLLAARIMDLAAQPDLARQLGRAGRHRLEKEFTLQQSITRHVDLYRSLIGGHV